MKCPHNDPSGEDHGSPRVGYESHFWLRRLKIQMKESIRSNTWQTEAAVVEERIPGLWHPKVKVHLSRR